MGGGAYLVSQVPPVALNPVAPHLQVPLARKPNPCALRLRPTPRARPAGAFGAQAVVERIGNIQDPERPSLVCSLT